MEKKKMVVTSDRAMSQNKEGMETKKDMKSNEKTKRGEGES